MQIIDDRRFPCCGARFRVDFAPGERVQRRCRACRRRYEVELVGDAAAESSWRLVFAPVVGRGAESEPARVARRDMLVPAIR